ncbi:flagellar assembly protein FliW [Tumebacillus permanentifrigoris]|uniref:Flagellar assembly factor FliW n=1 Tax=Tumebacillus permanentifrigoris TaxID=378543 RepID=A0A316DDY9_9BACL|nr:flagellar assembly protein FliW [Tumebacillus permanentifrigoris]PWK16185.1 flagellar assembly factor FliW [Tumebacillus permanentifrigoris]
MEITSVLFGKLEIEEHAILQFPEGLFGLEEVREYVIFKQDDSLPFAYLQAKEEPGVCLLLADPFVFHPAYEFELSAQDLQALGDPEPMNVQLWVTVTTTEEMEHSTMNLLAPIVVNADKSLARQVVLHNTGYQSRTPLFPRKGEA